MTMSIANLSDIDFMAGFGAVIETAEDNFTETREKDLIVEEAQRERNGFIYTLFFTTDHLNHDIMVIHSSFPLSRSENAGNK